MTENARKSFFLYVGTMPNQSEGIYAYRFDSGSGSLKFVGKTLGIQPFFLTTNSRQDRLYATNAAAKGSATGDQLVAFSVNRETGELTRLNEQPSKGNYPCYLSVAGGGRFLFAAHYTSGSLSVFPLQADGRLGEATTVISHQDFEPKNKSRLHSIVPDRESRFVVAADLGLDRVFVYRLDAEAGTLTPHATPWVQTAAGMGPRHFIFHPNGRFAYVIQEHRCFITAFNYEAVDGRLTEAETVSTLPGDHQAGYTGADIHLSPDGKFLYAANRGHNSIVIFKIDQQTGALKLVGHEPTLGDNPWNFVIDPAGTFLLVANQMSDSIVIFRIDRETGKLQATGESVETPKPVCLELVRAR